MSGFPILDLVIGMIFIFFLLSIICSSAVELCFSALRTRAALLEKWLKTIFDSPALNSDGTATNVNVGQAIMDHCMARALSATGKSPTYINAVNFVSALLDKITIVPAAGAAIPAVQIPPANLQGYINAITASTSISGEVKRTILVLAHEAQSAAAMPGQIKSELDHFRQRLELWYDKNAERLTGKFKSTRVLSLTFAFSIIIVVGLNADSIAIGRYLYANKDVSKQLADQAIAKFASMRPRMEPEQKDVAAPITPADSAGALRELEEARLRLKEDIGYVRDSLSAKLPLGWEGKKIFSANSLKHIPGWLGSILAICLGAPFWFDILNKIANLRGTGQRPPTNTDEKN